MRSEVFCNLTAEAIFDSIRRMKEAIAACHIFVLCGGFSAGDEPDGSGKFCQCAEQQGYFRRKYIVCSTGAA